MTRTGFDLRLGRLEYLSYKAILIKNGNYEITDDQVQSSFGERRSWSSDAIVLVVIGDRVPGF